MFANSHAEVRLRGFHMLFAIFLGAIIGAAGVTLIGQWLRGAMTLDASRAVLTARAFPRLAPSERAPRYTPRLWHRAA